MLSFVNEGIEKFIAVPKYGVIKTMCEILQKISREKITRISFMIFKNIQHSSQCLELMIDNRLLKIVDTLLKGNIKEEKLIEDIKNIGV
jgi:V-type H+-transporting ATPase subunit H